MLVSKNNTTDLLNINNEHQQQDGQSRKRRKIGLVAERTICNDKKLASSESATRFVVETSAEVNSWVWTIIFDVWSEQGMVSFCSRELRSVCRTWNELFERRYVDLALTKNEFDRSCLSPCRRTWLNSCGTDSTEDDFQPVFCSPKMPFCWRMLQRVRDSGVKIPWSRPLQKINAWDFCLSCPRMVNDHPLQLSTSFLSQTPVAALLPFAHLMTIDFQAHIFRDQNLLPQAIGVGKELATTLVEHLTTQGGGMSSCLLIDIRNYFFLVGFLWREHVHDVVTLHPLLHLSLRIVRLALPIVSQFSKHSSSSQRLYFERDKFAYRATKRERRFSQATNSSPLFQLLDSFKRNAFLYFRATPSSRFGPGKLTRSEIAGLC